LAALDTKFAANSGLNPANKWSSTLFHNGSPHVLCAKLYEDALLPKVEPMGECALEFVLFNADTNEALGSLESTVCKEAFAFNIQAHPNADCPTTLSAYMELTSEIHEERTENLGPYMIFGDRNGEDFFGKVFRGGDHMISSQNSLSATWRETLLLRARWNLLWWTVTAVFMARHKPTAFFCDNWETLKNARKMRNES